jgi:hypothetical protein
VAFDPSAQFRRSGQRDERRRRLLSDEHLAGGESISPAPTRRRTAVRHKSEHYGDAEFLDHARRLIDLVPRSLVVWLLLILAGVTSIVGLEALHASMLDWRLERPIAAFELGANGGLAAWFSSLLLVAATVAATIVYSVRRQRTDDYRGRYRIWLAAAACCFLLATNEATNLNAALQALVATASGSAISGQGSAWWVGAYVLVLGAVAIRLTIDMRESRLALGALLLTGVTVLVGALFGLEALRCATAAGQVMVVEGARMSAHLLLLVSIGLFARHVLLDAEGQLPRRTARAPRVDKAQPPADNAPPAAEGHATGSAVARPADPPHALAAPKFSSPAAPRDEVEAETDRRGDDEELVAAETERKLSKVERKALRHKQLQDRLKREQQSRTKWK